MNKTSPAQTTATSLESTDAAQQAQQVAAAGQSIASADQSIASSQPLLSSIETPQANGQTALQQGLTQQLTQQTAQSYQNAQVDARQNALQSGLSTSQAGVGNESAVGAQEASALGQIPSQVEAQVVPQELSAAGLTNQQAGLQNQQAGLQAGLASTLSPNNPLQTEAGLTEEQEQANSALWTGLTSAALSPLSAYIGTL